MITGDERLTPYDRRKYLRQHMMEYGLQAMPIVDVVELILYYTKPRGNVRPVAEALVKRFGSIDRMAKASSAERRSVKGIDELTDEHFAMIGMFIPYVFRSRLGEYPVFDTYEKLEEFCVSLHVMHEYEVLYALCLDARDRLIKKEVKIGVGTPEYINIELKHIMDAVANTATVQLVLCHNHPSGVLEPSTNDIKFTRVVQAALDKINIHLADHLIVADNRSVSMRAWGALG